MNYGQLLTICEKLPMVLIIHAIAKFVFLTFDAYCKVNGEVFSGVTQIWESIVRKKDEVMQRRKRDCLFGECDKCGVNLLPLCPKETEGSNDYVVTWRQFVLE
jgi:hypothetical protein